MYSYKNNALYFEKIGFCQFYFSADDIDRNRLIILGKN